MTPSLGVMRYADAGYPDALDEAERKGIRALSADTCTNLECFPTRYSFKDLLHGDVALSDHRSGLCKIPHRHCPAILDKMAADASARSIAPDVLLAGHVCSPTCFHCRARFSWRLTSRTMQWPGSAVWKRRSSQRTTSLWSSSRRGLRRASPFRKA